MLLVKGDDNAQVKALKARLAKELGSEAAVFPGLATGSDFDADTEAAARRWQAGVGILADGIVGPYCQVLLGLQAPQPLELSLDLASVRRLFPATKPSNIARYLPYVCASLAEAGLTDRSMILAALGTIRAESEGFLPISEYPSQFNTKPGLPPFSAYDGRLGNDAPGDGARYRGRGFVQLTGKANYRTYSQRLGIDLVGNPDWANAPEIASMLLVSFLADRVDAMRKALAASNYAAARKLVNGGSHGLDRFRSVFEIASTVWPVVAVPTLVASTGARISAKGRRGKAVAPAVQAVSAMPVKAARTLDVRKDPTDLRDRPYLPPPLTLPDECPSQEKVGEYLSIYTRAKLILDQGQEGACTGFGLACVVNYARWRKADCPAKLESVSPRMLYNFARRYDEYAGEDYDGSSCRGALKGWFHHGVCLENDWPYDAGGVSRPRYGYAQRAADLTLGVYFRVDIQSITDLQAAIHQVGAVYVSAFTHEGWQNVRPTRSAKLTHETLPRIDFDGRASKTGGHAFALVGFNTHGFVIQNSWGPDWGAGGFALLHYEDWLANAMDAWVASLGVRGVVVGRLSSRTVAVNDRSAAAPASAWDEARAYEHSIVLGNDGRVQKYLTQDELSRALLFQACGLPDQWFRDPMSPKSPDGKRRLVIYAHGGLNSEADAIMRARVMGRYFIGNGCYPLFLVWKTGLLESIGDIIGDAFRREPARAGGLRDSLIEATDAMVEKTIGRPLARPLWSEMKENADFACNPTRGCDLLVTALQNLCRTWGDELEIHLVGHSAGSIILGHMLQVLTQRGLSQRIASIHLYAPACTVQFANRYYAPHQELMKRLYLNILSEKNERDDSVAAIYRKSLLYLVSNALEPDVRTPLLGMANVLDPAYAAWDGSSATGEALGNWRNAFAVAGLGDRTRLLEADRVRVAEPDQFIRASHGCFDNDIDTIAGTLALITKQPALTLPVTDLRGF
ncbi:C1 family peptidase [Variovorax dokdonensis]|uniref:C1 family peptidase n=1 Tax=Variovorax dokdonensis TaxID=344883 RepID=A0ABT7N8I6_9BURK|nr:C1 family peptidase [Variovorax dokdonensis]MDM0044248.1 C1 family peptidase [Variovorax dokdonensis]